MTQTIQPLKNNWKIDEDKGFVADQIKQRVDSEDNLVWAIGWPIIKSKDIRGKLGSPK